ncbi:hypothetical protein BGZ97_008952, partial [Linnemannia gamsii]
SLCTIWPAAVRMRMTMKMRLTILKGMRMSGWGGWRTMRIMSCYRTHIVRRSDPSPILAADPT